jgi:hypothetical protein
MTDDIGTDITTTNNAGGEATGEQLEANATSESGQEIATGDFSTANELMIPQ